MDTMTTLKKWQDDYFTLVKKVEEPVVRYAGRFAAPVARYVPERPTFLAPMPLVGDLVDNQLRFRRRLLDEQVAFVNKLMKAVEPVMAKMDHVAKAPRVVEHKAAHKAA